MPIHPHHNLVEPPAKPREASPDSPFALDHALLPESKFGVLVGTVDHVTLTPHGKFKPDDNHVFIWLKVGGGPYAGRYECAVNTQSSPHQAAKPDPREVQYYLEEELIDSGEFPSIGFDEAAVSYAKLKLKAAQFHPILSGNLRSLIYSYAGISNLVAVYGHTYDNGKGMHDVHLNSSNDDGSEAKPPREDQDGLITFYFRRETARSRRARIFIKFINQPLK